MVIAVGPPLPERLGKGCHQAIPPLLQPLLVGLLLVAFPVRQPERLGQLRAGPLKRLSHPEQADGRVIMPMPIGSQDSFELVHQGITAPLLPGYGCSVELDCYLLTGPRKERPHIRWCDRLMRPLPDVPLGDEGGKG